MQRVVSRRTALGGVAALVGLGAGLSLVGCTPTKPQTVPSDEGVTPAATVQAVDNAFTPAVVTIKPGEAVRWEFSGAVEHDVVAGDGSFVSDLQRSGSYTHVFDTEGQYLYDCSIHPEMTGVVHVVK